MAAAQAEELRGAEQISGDALEPIGELGPDPQHILALRARDEDAETRALVNPSIVERSDDLELEDEGCLSLQGVVVPVERALRIRLEARDAEGNPVELELEGLGARVAQHEVDHLDGVLIVDRTTPEGRREALAVLRQATAI